MSGLTTTLLVLLILVTALNIYWYRATRTAHIQLARILHILRISEGGVLRRREENRAALTLLITHYPEIIRRHPSIVRIAKSHDLHLSALATIVTQTEWHDLPPTAMPWPTAHLTELQCPEASDHTPSLPLSSPVHLTASSRS